MNIPWDAAPDVGRGTTRTLVNVNWRGERFFQVLWNRTRSRFEVGWAPRLTDLELARHLEFYARGFIIRFEAVPRDTSATPGLAARSEPAQAASTPGVENEIRGFPTLSQHADAGDGRKDTFVMTSESIGKPNDLDKSWLQRWRHDLLQSCRRSELEVNGELYITQ